MNKLLRSSLFWLAITSVIVKLIYLFAGHESISSIARLSVDELYHYNWATAIASGDIFANAPYFRAPLYPYILSILLKISGNSLLFVRIVQLLAGCLSVLLLYKITLSLTDKKIALLAGLLYLFYPPATFFEAELLLDGLFNLFALATVYFSVKTEGKSPHPGLSGLFFGLAAITRPTILIFAPVLLYIFWKNARQQQTSIYKSVLPLVITIALCILPVTVINYYYSSQVTLVAYQGGINFFIGNNSEANGLYSNLPGIGEDWNLEDVEYLTRTESGRDLLYGQQSLYWYGRGIDYLVENQTDGLKLFIKKLYFFFSSHEIDNNRDLELSIYQNPILRLFPVRYFIIFGFIAFPLILKSSYRSSYLKILGIVGLYGIVISMFFVSSRFRLPIMPFIMLLASIGVFTLIQAVQNRDFSIRLFFSLIFAVGISFYSISSVYPEYQSDYRHTLYNRGNQMLRAGDYNQAIIYYDSINSISGYFENSHINLGIAYMKTGNTSRAIRAFQTEISQNSKSAEAYNNIAALFLVNHSYDSAMYYATQAIRLKPYYKEAAMNLLRIATEDAAVRENTELLRLQFRMYVEKYPEYLFEEALYLTALNRMAEAIDNHLIVLEMLETPPRISFNTLLGQDVKQRKRLNSLANYQLGYLYGLSGMYEQSIRFSKASIHSDSLCKEAYINLISGYRSIGENYQADSIAAKYISIWSN
ncbi:MAG: glycosyltransferase family 39 protein [candidate division Zixibacteria bacterium]|nr:glycosyltransferase family 39 protein [candidate division Zixibacteria bacterium]